jgi:septal ring-binding cell division protein DamX
MDGSYRLNINSQNIVQSAARERAVSTAVVQKMTQQKAAIRVFRRTVYGTNCQLACSTTTALILLLGGGVADAANPTMLAETGGFLLGNDSSLRRRG